VSARPPKLGQRKQRGNESSTKLGHPGHTPPAQKNQAHGGGPGESGVGRRESSTTRGGRLPERSPHSGALTVSSAFSFESGVNTKGGCVFCFSALFFSGLVFGVSDGMLKKMWVGLGFGRSLIFLFFVYSRDSRGRGFSTVGVVVGSGAPEEAQFSAHL